MEQYIKGLVAEDCCTLWLFVLSVGGGAPLEIRVSSYFFVLFFCIYLSCWAKAHLIFIVFSFICVCELGLFHFPPFSFF